MFDYQIRTFDDVALKQQVNIVQEFDGKLDALVNSMYTFLDDNAIGLAANQIGVLRSVFVFKLSGQRPRHIINPQVGDFSSDYTVANEGCLSFPGYVFEIPRFRTIELKGFDVHGKEIVLKGSGLKSCLFQHELDHLNAITPPMRATNTKRLY